ncbi:hypothetical protein Cylst_6502 (plasmid) [Cylindrospermum stagnale PCC 7417]|uniref:Uncharacterized protein n=1 Tax=Cylindrospermum stagnale PCC 7417 TaxID=56107 RepID=K9X717_9NOST|nr:hypothetical protein [Cylindrospermum stagnale]AFZ28283.1 hypothetical protein Cylst_6502 [Cylindrospermum stagnale PCC 7417]
MRPRRNQTSCNSDIFLDYPATKTELADILGVHRNTVVNWCDLAFWRIGHFRNAYPKKSDGTTDRESPLSPYQSWVICKLGRAMLHTRNKERLKEAIKAKQNEFSRYAYENQRKNVFKLGA